MMECFNAGQFEGIDPQKMIKQIKSLEFSGNPPFNAPAKDILSTLSKSLLTSPQAKLAPELSVLGFWLRPSRVDALEKEFFSGVMNPNVAAPRGIAFHLPPQNVDTLFVYSWALSLLAGNINVVRLPSQMPDILSYLLDEISGALHTHNAAKHQIFCRYPHENSINAEISNLADLRIIWGGDEKVQMVSKDPVRPDGLSIGFPDRKSYTLLNRRAYSQIDDKARETLAQKLYNDIYWFDQLGCGSPRILFWLGDGEDLSDDLYERLDKEAHAKNYQIETGVGVDKFAYMNEMIASGLAKEGKRYSNCLSILKAKLSLDLLSNVQGGGLLIEVEVADINELTPILNRQTQTITHFGCSDEQLALLAQLMIGKGGYRIVPIGEALSFSHKWDGLDLLSNMTRQISVKP